MWKSNPCKSINWLIHTRQMFFCPANASPWRHPESGTHLIDVSKTNCCPSWWWIGDASFRPTTSWFTHLLISAPYCTRWEIVWRTCCLLGDLDAICSTHIAHVHEARMQAAPFTTSGSSTRRSRSLKSIKPPSTAPQSELKLEPKNSRNLAIPYL